MRGIVRWAWRGFVVLSSLACVAAAGLWMRGCFDTDGILHSPPGGGSIDVYEPISGHKLIELRAAPGHWNSPIVVGGRIIEPVGNANDHDTRGAIFIYHLPGR